MKPINVFLSEQGMNFSDGLLARQFQHLDFVLLTHREDIDIADVVLVSCRKDGFISPSNKSLLDKADCAVPVISIQNPGECPDGWLRILPTVTLPSAYPLSLLPLLIRQLHHSSKRQLLKNKLDLDCTQRLGEIRTLVGMGIQFTSTLSRLDLYQLIMTKAQELIPSGFGFFATILKNSSIATIRAQFGLDTENRFHTPTRRLFKAYMDTLKNLTGPICDINPFVQHRLLRDEVIAMERMVESMLLSPVKSKDQLIGYIVMGNREDGLGFSESDCDRIEVLADFASVAIENAFLYEQTELLAQIDDLTRLYNFGAGCKYIENLIRENDDFVIMFLDLDGFKKVNEIFGHLAGNEALQKVSEIIRTQIRVQDLASRFGGDEFMIVMPGMSLEQAVPVCKSLIEAIEKERMFKDLTLSGSTGLAQFPDHGQDLQSIIQAADSAMYQAKSRGRGQVVIFGEISPTGVHLDEESV